MKVFAGGKLHSEIVLMETGVSTSVFEGDLPLKNIEGEAIGISYGHGMWAHTINYINTR